MYIWCSSHAMQFHTKVQKSYAVYKMIKPARMVQNCFETLILPQAGLLQELRSINTFVQPRAVFLSFCTLHRIFVLSRETTYDEPTNIHSLSFIIILFSVQKLSESFPLLQLNLNTSKVTCGKFENKLYNGPEWFIWRI